MNWSYIILLLKKAILQQSQVLFANHITSRSFLLKSMAMAKNRCVARITKKAKERLRQKQRFLQHTEFIESLSDKTGRFFNNFDFAKHAIQQGSMYAQFKGISILEWCLRTECLPVIKFMLSQNFDIRQCSFSSTPTVKRN